MNVSLRLISVFACLYPWHVDVSSELRDALAFLDWTVNPSLFVRSGYGAGAVVGGGTALITPLVSPQLRVGVVLLSVALTLGVAHVIHVTPCLIATARRTSALGAAPDLIARAVLRMRLTPAPERAATFVARTSDSALARSLETHVRATRNSGQSGLIAFGDTWSDLFPSLRRSVTLLVVAGRTPSADRHRLLNRSLSVVLDGVSETLQTFGARIRGPVTALYAFGVLLPTALVALLPAAGAAGIVVTPGVVIVLYNICLPLSLTAASIWVLVRRPVAFPPPEVTYTHPKVADKRVFALLCGGIVAVASWFGTALFIPQWGPPVAAAGFGTGTVLLLATRPIVSVYDRIRTVEASLSDALELVGRRVANGHAVETAIEKAANELNGPMGTVLADGVRQQRQLQIGVHEAFLGRHGVLENVPSPRVRGSVALLSLAAREGRPAGAALLSLAEHVDDLQQIEREARQQLLSVCRTLTNTATLFGPMVAGSTVALADGISSGTALLGGGQSFSWLGGPVGIYVLLLAVILTVLSVGLVRGFDHALIGYRVGRGLLSATGIYLCSYLCVGTIV
ncbi:type II secretion system F family protein [Halovenus rubra]|uniref:Type II secretion system F family protein n=2 Tax=Halovenus rubra TaxID=869890 RepID=A0ABD5X9U2_9EURY|nr:type II secretion system F family protein [Halovenus rubra]